MAFQSAPRTMFKRDARPTNSEIALDAFDNDALGKSEVLIRTGFFSQN